MDQLIELLKQIQELSGVGIKALGEASGKGGGEHGGPPEGSPAEEAAESPAEEAKEPDAQQHGGGGKPPWMH